MRRALDATGSIQSPSAAGVACSGAGRLVDAEASSTAATTLTTVSRAVMRNAPPASGDVRTAPTTPTAELPSVLSFATSQPVAATATARYGSPKRQPAIDVPITGSIAAVTIATAISVRRAGPRAGGAASGSGSGGSSSAAAGRTSCWPATGASVSVRAGCSGSGPATPGPVSSSAGKRASAAGTGTSKAPDPVGSA